MHERLTLLAEQATIGYTMGSCKCQVREEGAFEVDELPSSILFNTQFCQGTGRALTSFPAHEHLLLLV